MSQYRTAQGRSIDMASLAAKNERTRAVGNMKVNARGDTIDGAGRIIQPATEKVTNQYARTVGNPAARQVTTNTNSASSQYAAPVPDPIPVSAAPVEEKLDVEDDFNDQDDIEIEQIKQQDIKKQETKKGNK